MINNISARNPVKTFGRIKMSDCCSVSNTDPVKSASARAKRHVCPENGKIYAQVARTTILHHVQQPWLHGLEEQNYYFCDDPDCEVVYFGDDDSVINKNQLRTQVGIKQTSPEALICYCFGVSRHEAETSPQAKAFVVEQTRQSQCACETRNPSGRCCLKDFPKGGK